MIGDLYNANNVVVGQAAAFIGPQYTPLPPITTGGVPLSDPFSEIPWAARTLTLSDAAANFTLSVNGVATGALSGASTAAEIQDAVQALLTGTQKVTVTGVSPGPYVLVFNESALAVGAGNITTVSTTGSAVISGGLWNPVGATDQGWKFNTNKSTSTINIEEQSTPAGMAISTQTVSFDASLSEDISTTLAIAYNGLLTKSAAASGVPGFDRITLTDTILYYAVALVTQHFNGMPRWIYSPKCSQLANSSTDFRRATAKRMYPVAFESLCKPEEIQIVNFTSAGQ